MMTLLYSGGLDSSCLWWLLGKPPALHFGGPLGPAREAWEGEKNAIMAQCKICPEFERALKIAAFDFRPFMRENVWMFPRDQICCIAAWASGADSVAIGWVKEDGTTLDWAMKCKAKLEATVGMPGFTVNFPIINLSKRQLVERALALGAPMEFLKASYSCVRNATPCGECNGCKHAAATFKHFEVHA